MRQFLIKYQDRVLYATDLEFYPRQKTEETISEWQARYMTDWKFFSTDATVDYEGHKVHGLHLPEPVLRKIFHDNAIKWVPGIIPH